MSIKANVTRAKTDYDEVYDAGKKAEYDAFWDGMQSNGKRTSYTNGFYQWANSKINPKYPIKTTNCSYIFHGCANLLALPPITLTNTSGTNFAAAFTDCRKITEVDLDCVCVADSGALTRTFQYCRSLVRIRKISPQATNAFSNTFQQCYALTDVTFDGVIANDINFQDCPLSVDSMISIITHLKNYVFEGAGNEFTRTVYFNDDCWARLEASGIVPDAGDGTWLSYVNDVLGWDV